MVTYAVYSEYLSSELNIYWKSDKPHFINLCESIVTFELLRRQMY